LQGKERASKHVSNLPGTLPTKQFCRQKAPWPRVFWNVDVASVKPVKPCKPNAGQVIWTRGTNRCWMQNASLNLLPMLYWAKQSTAIASWLRWPLLDEARIEQSSLAVLSLSWFGSHACAVIQACWGHASDIAASTSGSEQECCKLHEYTRDHRKSCIIAYLGGRKLWHMQQYNRTYLAHRVHPVPATDYSDDSRGCKLGTSRSNYILNYIIRTELRAVNVKNPTGCLEVHHTPGNNKNVLKQGFAQ